MLHYCIDLSSHQEINSKRTVLVDVVIIPKTQKLRVFKCKNNFEIADVNGY